MTSSLLFFRRTRFVHGALGLALLLVQLQILHGQPQQVIVHVRNGPDVHVPGLHARNGCFLVIDSVANRLPITVRTEGESGLLVLCTTSDCRAVYAADRSEMLIMDGVNLVNVEILAEALDCHAKIKRKRDVYLTCAEGWPEQKVGAQVGERAPGFRLKASADSAVALNDLLSRGPVVVAFVRSGQWDPLSRLLLEALESKLDSLRRAGCEVVALHGYEPKVGTKWAAELKLNFPQLADNASAVMRGYEVFDQGHLPHCAVFLLDREGMIRYRQVYEDALVVPDLEPLMREVRGMRDEG